MRSRRGLNPALFALALAASSPATAEDRALIVGVDRYPNLPAAMQLTASVNDAHLMARVAEEVWGFDLREIKLLLDEEATSESIIASIRTWVIAGTNPGDRVLVSFSGHGYHVADLDGDESDGEDETIAGSDVQPEAGGFANMILDDQIAALIDQLAGRNVMVVIDSCHSGTITRALDPRRREGDGIVRSLDFGHRNRGLSGQILERVRRDKAFMEGRDDTFVWTAVSATQLAQEDVSAPIDSRNGVFTGAFAEGLIDQRADANQNGKISTAELLAYVRTRAVDYCEQFACETGMTPTLEVPASLLATNLLKWGGQNADTVVVANVTSAEPTAPADEAATRVEPAIHDSSGDDVVTTADAVAVATAESQTEVPQYGEAATPETGSPEPNEGSPIVAPPAAGDDWAATLDDLITHDNKLGVTLEILPGPNVALGDDIHVRVTSPKPGYLVLLDLRDDGEVYQLFPSICAPPERRLRAGAALTLPDKTYGCVFQATKAGSGRILAIVSEDNVALEDLLSKHRDLELVPDPSVYLTSLVQQLLAIWTGDERNRAVDWALASADYRVRN